MPTTPLTTLLLAHDPEGLERATRAPFLKAAGTNQLPLDILSSWLAQDRLYAQAYIRFASLILANIPLRVEVDGGGFGERLTDLIISAINNVRRELKFFESTAAKYGLDLEVRPDGEGGDGVSKGVKGYRDLFNEVGEGIEKGEKGVLDGMVVLWGTEKVYLNAWRYAASFLTEQSSGEISDTKEDQVNIALREEFIPNWSSAEFEAFVVEIEELVNETWGFGEGREDVGFGGEMEFMFWGKAAGRGHAGCSVIKEREERLKSLKGLCGRVLVVEEGFWPVVEG